MSRVHASCYTRVMKLIVLYGPPGVGKLTVAQTLAKKLGYKVLHNHLTIELLCSLFDWGSKPYSALVKRYRFDLLEQAAKYKIKGVIVTYVYPAEADDQEMKELVRRMNNVGTTVCFVQLLCSQQELEKRIKYESRKKYTKIRHITSLRNLMNKYDVLARVPLGNNLTIDNSKLSPAKTATTIINHFHLK